jgi:outer membrane protein assembly factor BamD
MIRRLTISAVLLAALAMLAACSNKHVQNPIANVNSKQPDKVLFDRAMDAMKHNHFDVARITLQTLINTYPDSEYIARAKLAVGDSWYAEGGSAGLAQAEIEYKDFITFFPNMPEAAEAQLKVANIHFRQMEKPDRDFTHAKRAEDEYRQLILQFPDSKLVPEAKRKLLQVQEVLAEREYRIGRFYYLRESWAAAEARLKSLTDTYPLYSKADDALFMLGDAYERQAAAIRGVKSCSQGNTAPGCLPEETKGKMIATFENQAAEAYAKIVTRYPVMDRVGDARKRLAALHKPVPTPTAAAIAQNKAEEDSRGEMGVMGRTMATFHRSPDVSAAAKVGEPTLVDPKQTNATEIARQLTNELNRAGTGANTVAGQIVGKGAPPPNEATPRSDLRPATETAAPGAAADANASTSASPAAQPAAAPAAGSQPAGEAIPELIPNLSPATPVDQNPPAADASSASTATGSTSTSSTSSDSSAAQSNQQSSDTAGSNSQSQSSQSDQNTSSSKSKKKKKKFLAF